MKLPVLEERVTSDIPTTLHRSKFDCPVPEEMVTVSVDGSVLDRIAKIMTYLRLGSSGKVLKKKKKERDVKGSDDEDDLSKMDMGGRAKGRLHRWDFETEEEWAKYNYEKEAMPKAAFQFGVKMQDGRKTRKRTRTRSLRMTSIRSTRSWLGRRVRKMGQKMVVTTMNR